MSSSNPFRKKGPPAPPSLGDRFPALEPIDTSPAAMLPPTTSFRMATSPTELSEIETPKSKPVKKVRVVSPPPLSPDSPEWPFNAPPPSQHSTQNASQGAADFSTTDPFGAAQRHEEEKHEDLIQERRDEGAALKAANRSNSGGMDVSAFHRLLMTGVSTAHSTGTDTPDTVSTSETSTPADISEGLQSSPQFSSTLTQNPVDDLTSESDASVAVNIGARGKKAPPPPPSSRHGRSISELPDSGADLRTPKPVKDINKPLPTAPHVSGPEADYESPFDREAAGKVPEAVESDQTPSTPLQAAATSPRKPAPAPPPQRGRSRGDSLSRATSALTASRLPVDTPPRSSTESLPPTTHDNPKAAPAVPAPPPPRRPNAANRLSSLGVPTVSPFPSPALSDSERPSSSSSYQPEMRDLASPGNSKQSGPPPPPARHSSVRRAAPSAAAASIADSPRQREGTAAPPPPPTRRARGSSRSSVDGPPRRTSIDSVAKGASLSVAEEPSPSTAEPGKGVDILADLDALQREVDALRQGKLP